MGDPCAACTHAYDGHACDKCIDFGDWTPCRQLAPIVERIRAEERERCGKICADRAARLSATAEQYPTGTAACFEAEARECERRIRNNG